MATKANVLFLGSPFWCRYLVRLLNRYGYLNGYTATDAMRWMTMKEKALCLVGVGAPDTVKRWIYHAVAAALQFTGLANKKVIYWIGSDVTRLRTTSRFISASTNIAGSPWLADEVRQKGIECRAIWFPVELAADHAMNFPRTSRLQVLAYLPDAHHQLHGSAEVRTLVERFEDAEFTVIGGRGDWWQNHPENVRFVGWTSEPLRYIERAHVILRRTAHDSLSAFVREGLIAGRHVIFTYAFPGAIHVPCGDTKSLTDTLNQLQTLFFQSLLGKNQIDPHVRDFLEDVESQLRSLADVYR